jgi:hypothetical protein
LEPIAAPNEVANNVPIPEAFREIIETLELPASLEEEEREGREM